ncbi:uncharacterized protein LOC128680300 [Plodia interpunctella]|uniref:uncharacterized protein LOC128680300 n=1 Tax=Plodia interpunctella TaxID=58824 RepID=UPI0031010B6B
MYCELPEFRRCCFCLPLRRGVLTLAYVNIALCIMVTFLTLNFGSADFRILSSYSEMPYELNVTLFILDIIVTIILVVGLHMKRELLARIYYYFMIFSLCSSVLLTIIDVVLMKYAHFKMLAVFNLMFSLVINFYLLLLVRSLVKKLQVSSGNTFGNQLAEFIEGPSLTLREPDQNGTVTIAIPDENADTTKTNQIFTILQVLVLYMIEVDDLSAMLLLRNVNYYEMPVIFTIAACVLEVAFNILLIYGTHTKRPSYIKIYYYFMISMLLTSVILEILSVCMSRGYDGFWILYFMFCLIINLYLLFLVRSLIVKLEVSDCNKFSNQLADFIDRASMRHNTVYTEIVVPRDSNTV